MKKKCDKDIQLIQEINKCCQPNMSDEDKEKRKLHSIRILF